MQIYWFQLAKSSSLVAVVWWQYNHSPQLTHPRRRPLLSLLTLSLIAMHWLTGWLVLETPKETCDPWDIWSEWHDMNKKKTKGRFSSQLSALFCRIMSWQTFSHFLTLLSKTDEIVRECIPYCHQPMWWKPHPPSTVNVLVHKILSNTTQQKTFENFLLDGLWMGCSMQCVNRNRDVREFSWKIDSRT